MSDYLWIPTDSLHNPHGLRWSANGEAIDYPDGRTFALAAQIRLFLEGLAADGAFLHFVDVLHLLYLFGLGHDKELAEFELLRRTFADAGRPLRNAGALAAVLTRRVPRTSMLFNPRHVDRRLASPQLLAEMCTRWTLGPASTKVETPPLRPGPFREVVRDALTQFTAEELHHWLRHGHAPVHEAGEQMAAAVQTPVRTLESVLTELADSPRLAGAMPLVEPLAAALTLPPRRQPASVLSGGYADVASRGLPEQILPSQFALDDLEFVRRFAENELLYFRREEPHRGVREELIVLLDQGVRSWGVVRLALSAAVLVLGRLAVRRKAHFRIAATSSEGRVFDSLATDLDRLRTLVEASDLSLNPGAALDTLLQETATTPRDVVLLTHPRSLLEPDVVAAARRADAQTNTRLFALTVEDSGNARLAELRRGHAVAISSFRVNLSVSVVNDGKPAERLVGRSTWNGDVEPVPFPFRFGLASQYQKMPFDFDPSGEWLLEAGVNDVLLLWRIDRTRTELLPRPILNGVLLTGIEAIRGVRGGFVVCGRIEGKLAAAHYDLQRRHCRAYVFRRAGDEQWYWAYLPQCHTVVVRGEAVCLSVDLASGERASMVPGEHVQSDGRALLACTIAWQQGLFPPDVRVGQPIVTESEGLYLGLHAAHGELFFYDTSGEGCRFTPLTDGRKVFVDAVLIAAQHCGRLLAVLAQHPGRSGATIWLFRLPQGMILGEFAGTETTSVFKLSADGRWFAHLDKRSRVEVHDSERSWAVAARTPHGGFHSRVQVALGFMWLTMQCGTRTHLIRWDTPELEFLTWKGERDAALHQHLGSSPEQVRAVFASAGGLPAFAGYDRKRFLAAAHGPLTAVVDAYGQVGLFERNGTLVCMFFVFRHHAAAWTPDGLRCGSPTLTGEVAGSNAARRIAASLRAAWQRGSEGKA